MMDTAGNKKKTKSIEEKPSVTPNDKLRVLITTIPFGEIDPLPVKQLSGIKNLEYVINPFNRKIKEDELGELIKDFDFLIAGTEPITEKVLGNADRLKVISRVGIGLDSVDLSAARRKGISRLGPLREDDRSHGPRGEPQRARLCGRRVRGDRAGLDRDPAMERARRPCPASSVRRGTR